MDVITENKVIPKLRFSEFNEEWEIIKLQDLAIRITEKNRDNKIQTVLTNSATKGIVSQADYFDRDIANKNNLDGYYIVNIGDYVYNPRISKYAPVGPIKKNNLVLGLMSPLYSVFRFNTNEDEFFENYFETTAWHKYMKSVANYGARHDRMNISNSDFFKMSIPIPSLSEQQKIASFLSAVDEKLQQLTKKKDLLEEYKKGIMQKIFSQELRLKDEFGNNYPDWEEKRLVDFENLEHGDGDWILSKDISKNGNYKIIQLGNIGFGEYINKKLKTISKEKFIELNGTPINRGDLLINRMVDNNINVCIFDKEGEFITSVDVCWIRLNNYFNNYFLMSLIILNNNQNKLLRLSSGSGRVRISKKNLFEKFSFKLPSLKEQQRIANFLSSLDSKIDLVSTQIENTKAFKKGLLQQMFV